jgi:hypothetical protein
MVNVFKEKLSEADLSYHDPKTSGTKRIGLAQTAGKALAYLL